MNRLLPSAVMFFVSTSAFAADWTQFRGPGGLGRSDETGLPVKWSETENLLWKVQLPGMGTSCPITVGDAIFLTCYSGYAENQGKPGNQKDLVRQVICLDRKTGKTRWTQPI